MDKLYKVEVAGTLSNSITHSVVLVCENEDFSDICEENIKVCHIAIGRREAEQIELYNSIIYEGASPEFSRPTTIDLLCSIFSAFSGQNNGIGSIRVVRAVIDDMIENVFTAKLTLLLETENEYHETVLDARPSDVISIVLNQKAKGMDIPLLISEEVISSMEDIGDTPFGESSLREKAIDLVSRPSKEGS